MDTDEIEDARWLHKDWLAAQLRAADGGRAPAPVVRGGGSCEGPPFRIPGVYSLAHRIIHTWLHERAARTSGGEEGADAAAAALAAVPDVSIDEGTFKYVLLRLSTPDGELEGMLSGWPSPAQQVLHAASSGAPDNQPTPPTRRRPAQ